VKGKCTEEAVGKEEKVLEKERVGGECAGGVAAGRGGRGFLDACPGEVDVEEEEEGAESDYGRLLSF